MRLFIAVAIGALLLGCGLGRVDRTEAVADLEALLPTLTSDGVTDIYRYEDCHYFAYQRGVFVSYPDRCLLGEVDVAPRASFDDQARADLDVIDAESERLGQRLPNVHIEYAPDGKVARGSFWFEDDRSFEYEPGRSTLPDGSEATAINADWYEVIHTD